MPLPRNVAHGLAGLSVATLAFGLLPPAGALAEPTSSASSTTASDRISQSGSSVTQQGTSQATDAGSSAPEAATSLSSTPETPSATGSSAIPTESSPASAATTESLGTAHSMQQAALRTSATTAHSVSGAIGNYYNAMGGASSWLGAATSAETPVANGVYQQFTNGRIYWSSSTGAHAVHGAVLVEYLAVGGPAGSLGFPIGNETSTANGGTYQNFQGGAILWTSTTGAHTTHGAIRTEWLAQGNEHGYLGYPTSDETATANGGTYQNFQGGTIYWTSEQGAIALTPSEASAAQTLADNGFDNTYALVRAANDIGLPLGTAVALVAKESYGANVYGHDSGGALSGAGEVTQDNFTNQFMPLIRAGHTSNGVGPSQITYSGYFLNNPSLAWWDPYTNMCFGFTLMKGYLGGNYSDASLVAAGSTYNSGSATGAPYYGRSFADLAESWTSLLGG